MSGHSHWHSIKYKKTAADFKKSKVFSKIAREITLATREGGDNSEFNSKLRLAIEKAHSVNMPADNIEKAVKRGKGEIEEVSLREITFEAYGPGGIAILIEGITDNKNRSFSEIKQILNEVGGKLVGEGSVRWMFDRKGCLTLDLEAQNMKREDLELLSIEAGAQDFYWHEGILDVYTEPEHLEKVKKSLEEKGVKTGTVSLDWVAKEMVALDEKTKQNCQSLFEKLDENDTVQEIYSNLKT